MDLDAVSQEMKNKTKPMTKITSLDELPSLPVKNKAKDQEKKDTDKASAEDEDDEDNQKGAAADKDLAQDIKVEDIVKDIDPVLDDEKDDGKTTIIDEEESEDSFWDDVEGEDGQELDLNKPAFLRKLINKKRQRKKRKAEQAEEAEEDSDDSDDE